MSVGKAGAGGWRVRRVGRALALSIGVLTLAGLVPSPAQAAVPPPAPLMTVPNAAYSWWTQPLAVSDGPYTWVASIARLGTVRIARAQPSTGSVKWATLGISKVDDHNAPAIALSAAHPHLLAFYTQHGTDNVMRYRTVNRQTLAMGEEQAAPVLRAIDLRPGHPVAYPAHAGHQGRG